MLERATPAVVNIATRGKSRRRVELPLPNDPLFRHFFEVPSIERVLETTSLGSGVIVDAERGLILTNLIVSRMVVLPVPPFFCFLFVFVV